MTDIFISYQREINFEIYNNPISKFRENLKAQFQIKADMPLNIFFDTKSVKTGDKWKKTIDKGLNESEFLVVFFSIGYFNSDYCLFELNKFLNPKNGQEIKKDRIIPIQISTIEIKDIIKDENKKIYKQLKNKIQIFDLTEEFINPNKYEEKIKICINQIIPKIKNVIINRKKKRIHTKNIKIFNNLDLLNFEISNYESIRKEISNAPKMYNKYPEPVCIIYTGGTVGLIHDNKETEYDKNDLIQGKANEIVEYLPKLEELKINIHFFEITTIDSSNATINDWVNLAKLIDKLYNLYQGFVILHGANTMSYAASFLSFTFENLQKPIIFTGSENPLVHLNSEAELNILRSIQIVAHKIERPNVSIKIPDVCIFYGEKLYKGNRTTKYHAFNPRKGFATLNSPEIGIFINNRLNFTNDNLYTDNNIQNPISSKLINKKNLKTKIFMLDIYPDMPIEEYVKMMDNVEKIDGLILRTYGTGNPPDKPDDFLNLITRLMKRGTIVVNTTQSPKGSVLIKLYEKNITLFDLGVVNGGDMTREAAYTKLKWLLGTETNLETVKYKMQKNLRGELEYSAYNFIFNNKIKEINNKYYHFTEPIKIDGDLKQEEIKNVIIRITNIRILTKLISENSYILKITYNPQQNSYEQIKKEGIDKSLLATYERIIGPDESLFDKNIEITFDFKQSFQSIHDSIHLGVLFDPPLQFEFENLGLYVYTKSKR